MGDFTFLISLWLRPKLNLSDRVWCYSRLWISWADIFGQVIGWSKWLTTKIKLQSKSQMQSEPSL